MIGESPAEQQLIISDENAMKPTDILIPNNSISDSECDELDIADNRAALPAIELQVTPEACGMRLDKTLSALLPQYSRSRMQKWIEAGQVSVDGEVVRAKMLLFGNEKVVIHPQLSPEEQAFKAEPMNLAILHEDETILVIDKPVGLVVHPASGNWSGTLLNGLLHHFPAIAGVPRAGIVHRLDKDTSGLMVLAKTLVAHTDLVRQLQARTVKREYLALVWGTPNSSGMVDAAIGRHPRDRIKMAVSTNFSAKHAVTHYDRLATGMLDGKPVSLVCCRLETGRTHQIRVHMQSLGFTLVGDVLYGKQNLMQVFPRQALHARRLSLIHPVLGEAGEWSATLPTDFADLLERAGIAQPQF